MAALVLVPSIQCADVHMDTVTKNIPAWQTGMYQSIRAGGQTSAVDFPEPSATSGS